MKERDSKAALAIGAAATLFVGGTAIFTRNPGLIILASLSATSTLLLWQRRKRS